jgi:hypothetical protein
MIHLGSDPILVLYASVLARTVRYGVHQSPTRLFRELPEYEPTPPEYHETRGSVYTRSMLTTSSIPGWVRDP